MKSPSFVTVCFVLTTLFVATIAQEAPLYREVGPSIVGATYTLSGNNTAGPGPRDALFFTLAPAVTEVFRITNRYYPSYQSLSTPESTVTIDLVELIQYEEVSGDGYNPGVDSVRATHVPSSASAATYELREQSDDRVEGGSVSYFVVSSAFGAGNIVLVESAYSPIGITGASGSFDDKEISTNGVNMNINLDMTTTAFPWVAGQTSPSRLALHVRINTAMPLNSQSNTHVLFGGNSGVRQRISWEDESIATTDNDEEDINVEVTVGDFTSNSVDVYFAFEAEFEWDTMFWDPLVELDYADGESEFPDAANSLTVGGLVALLLAVVAYLF